MDLKDVENFLLRFLDPVNGEGKFNEWSNRTKHFVRLWLRSYVRTDMRWSYLTIFGMMAAGALINFFMPHGWTVWPVVMMVGMMLLIHEAADRNGEGIPPIFVYGFFIGAMLTWFLLMAVLSTVNPLILVIGLVAAGYYCALGYIKQREHKKLVIQRRMAGLCIYCGTPADLDLAYCPKCGREPDPEDARLKRVINAPRSEGDKKRARESLKPPPNKATMRAKEQMLLDRRRAPKFKKRM